MVAKTLSQIKISVLDLAIVRDGGNPADTFKNSLDLAQNAEKWGYNRFWLAEHHNMQGVASSATVVLNWAYCCRNIYFKSRFRRDYAS